MHALYVTSKMVCGCQARGCNAAWHAYPALPSITTAPQQSVKLCVQVDLDCSDTNVVVFIYG
jgi:hypothetical protein